LTILDFPFLLFDGYQSCLELARTEDNSKGNLVTLPRSELNANPRFELGEEIGLGTEEFLMTHSKRQ